MFYKFILTKNSPFVFIIKLLKFIIFYDIILNNDKFQGGRNVQVYISR